MNRHSRTLLLSSILVLSLLGANLVWAEPTLKLAAHKGPIAYVSGGIGLDESSAFKNAMKDWPLSLQFAEKEGERAHYVADIKVILKDANNQVVFSAKSDGPFMLIKVPVGVYKIDATLAGKALHQQIEVTVGQPAKVNFLWPTAIVERR